MLQTSRLLKELNINLISWGFILAPIFFISSCSIIKPGIKSYKPTKQNPWSYQLNLVGKQFQIKSKKIAYPREVRDYLDNLARKIQEQSDLNRKEKVKIIVVVNKTPFSYSLPHGEIILSSELINKYILSESFLAAIVAFELARIDTLAYKNHEIYPKGYLSLEEFLKLFQLDASRKSRLHQWAIMNMHHAGYNLHEYVNWIQTMNREYDEFKLTVPSLTQLITEESELKKFITANDEISLFQLEEGKKSPRIFYRFKNKTGQYK